MVWDCLIVGLLWLDHIQSLANVTAAAIATGKVGKLVLPTTSCYLRDYQLLRNEDPEPRNK
jgi:hypothetical protein